jgi:CelD/BcsL family acetyltransferase involved in cellulose biosynthesis
MQARSAIDVVSAREALESPALEAEWRALASEQSHTNSLFSSPEWVSHQSAVRPEGVHVVRVRSEAGRLIGVVPVRLRPYELRFDIAKTSLLGKQIQVAEILGSLPLLPACAEIHRHVVEEVFRALPACHALFADAVPVDSYFWSLLQGPAPFAGRAYVHITDGPRPWHLLTLSSSFEQYMRATSSKARANMRREVRQLAQRAGADLQAVRITSPPQVKDFLTRAEQVGKKSWQYRALGQRVASDDATQNSFEDLAARGLLRSYLLQAGDATYAFVVGYQHQEVYHYVEVAYDEAYAEFSPGKVLLTLMLEDLHKHDVPREMNFGVGDASYKRRFGNLERSDAGCLVLRSSLANRFYTTSHSLFCSAVKTVKRLIGRKVSK